MCTKGTMNIMLNERMQSLVHRMTVCECEYTNSIFFKHGCEIWTLTLQKTLHYTYSRTELKTFKPTTNNVTCCWSGNLSHQ